MTTVFIGFDSRTPAAYWIQAASIKRFDAHVDVAVVPLVQQSLRLTGAYWRENDHMASTEFTYTRFLVPFLYGHNGIAVFMDGDMLVRGDLTPLEMHLGDKAVAVVQHEYKPREAVKRTAGGLYAQSQYPRKNWSSMMVFNCGHPACRTLTPEVVNAAEPSYLHQLKWVDDADVVSLNVTWNWLEGWNTTEECPNPRVVHYTRGIPGIHEGFSAAPFAEEYIELMQTALYPGAAVCQ